MPVKKTGCLDVFVTLTRKWASSILTLSMCSIRTSTLEGWPPRLDKDSGHVRRSKLTRKMMCSRVLALTKPLSVSHGCISRKRSRYRGPKYYVFDRMGHDLREGLQA